MHEKHTIQRFPKRAVEQIWTAQFEVVWATRHHAQHLEIDIDCLTNTLLPSKVVLMRNGLLDYR